MFNPEIRQFSFKDYRTSKQIFVLPKDHIFWPVPTIQVEEPFDGSPSSLMLGTLNNERRYLQVDLMGFKDLSRASVGTKEGEARAFIERDREVFLIIKPNEPRGAVPMTQGRGWILYNVINISNLKGFRV